MVVGGGGMRRRPLQFLGYSQIKLQMNLNLHHDLVKIGEFFPGQIPGAMFILYRDVFRGCLHAGDRTRISLNHCTNIGVS